jgi:hypothetical protein
VGEETFFKKKVFFPQTPIFKEIATGGKEFIFVLIARRLQSKNIVLIVLCVDL